ncbi:MAG: L-rhamnose isomerase [Firmicutes bacterium]|nr:L-rhamnose isomerase [Bacillota bacterium]
MAGAWEIVRRHGQDPAKFAAALRDFHVETPSWGYGNAGTRFQVFAHPGAARNIFEKLADAAQVHRLTGICPTVAVHIPWDKVEDYSALHAEAEKLGVKIGAVNPNLFQEPEYMLGSLCHAGRAVRRKAADHLLECVRIAREVGSPAISLWLADGTNYPGQGHFRRRRQWLAEALEEVYAAMPEGMRLLIEYKPSEPGFYHTDIADWGSAYVLAAHLGPRAQVLVDLGHHPQGVNVEHIVATLLGEGRLGGFHFNDRKYADDDLIAGSSNPYQLFLIFNELVDAAQDADPAVAACAAGVAYMVDQSHNIEPKIPAMIRSVLNIQTALAKALLVDRQALAAAQDRGDVLAAEAMVRDAFETDVRPLLAQFRAEQGLPEDPLAAYYASDYPRRIATERGTGGKGWA